MKKIFNAALLGIGALALTACSDWLDTTSDSLLNEDVLYENAADVKLAVNSLYADLTSTPYTQYMTIHQGAGTDVELIDGLGSTSTGDTERGGMNYNATTSWSALGTLWEEQYRCIEDCNRIVAGIKNSSLENDEEIMACSAEARVIRAMVYLDMIRVFGDLPFMWSPAESDLSNINISKTDRDVILDSLIIDLEKVVKEDKLPWSGKGGSVTTEHINMGYAQGLLANIYMTRAGFAIRENENSHATAGGYSSLSHKAAKTSSEKNLIGIADPYKGYTTDKFYGSGTTYTDDEYLTLRPCDEDCEVYYTRAKALLNNIISMGYHDMNPSFANLWYNANQLKLDQTYYENMFEIPMGFGKAGELGYTMGVRLNQVTTDYGYGNQGGKVHTTASLLYSYSPCDLRRDITCIAFELKNIDRSTSAADGLLTCPGDGYDPLREVATEKGKSVTVESVLKNKPFQLNIGKWDVRKMTEQWKKQNKTASAKFGYGINVTKMRYPQILLWAAECEAALAELGESGDLEKARKYIQEVHDRGLGWYSFNSFDDRWECQQCGTIVDEELSAINKCPNCENTISIPMYKSYTGRLASEDKANFDSELADADDAPSIINIIDKENKLEFCGECFRKWDLIRWNRLHDDIVAAKKDYMAKLNEQVFPEKVYFRYLDYGDSIDSKTGIEYYKAPEKRIDWSSVTWYGVDGDNETPASTDISTAYNFFNDGHYRFNKAYDVNKFHYQGFGASYKDFNAFSYCMNAYGNSSYGGSESLEVELGSICGGLVGTLSNKATGECDDSQLKVKNRYLMPIYNNVISSSYGSDGNPRVYNSYEY